MSDHSRMNPDGYNNSRSIKAEEDDDGYTEFSRVNNDPAPTEMDVS